MFHHSMMIPTRRLMLMVMVMKPMTLMTHEEKEEQMAALKATVALELDSIHLVVTVDHSVILLVLVPVAKVSMVTMMMPTTTMTMMRMMILPKSDAASCDQPSCRTLLDGWSR